MSFRAFTKNQYPLDEVTSALQKEIRRGNERPALFWAMEMVPQFEKYMWYRLLVIVHEDIGIANPNMFFHYNQMRESYYEMRAKKSGSGLAGLVLTNLILLMCRSPKSRISINLSTVVQQQRRRIDKGIESKVPIPDYALDRHTVRGNKSLRRGWDHFFADGALLSPAATAEQVPDPYEAESIALWKSSTRILEGDGLDWEKLTPTGNKKGTRRPDDDSEPDDNSQSELAL